MRFALGERSRSRVSLPQENIPVLQVSLFFNVGFSTLRKFRQQQIHRMLLFYCPVLCICLYGNTLQCIFKSRSRMAPALFFFCSKSFGLVLVSCVAFGMRIVFFLGRIPLVVLVLKTLNL